MLPAETRQTCVFGGGRPLSEFLWALASFTASVKASAAALCSSNIGANSDSANGILPVIYA